MDMPMPPSSNHGFSLLGKSSLVFSHIPMFMVPHQAQLFLEVELSGTGGQNPTQIYLDDMAKSGTTNYVFICDPIVLATLGPHSPKRLTQLTGKLFRGWPFNNPNTAPLLAEGITAKITKSLYFQDITKGHPLKDLTYLSFGTEEGAYLVHKLIQPADLKTAPKPPDFVQILSGKLGGVHGPHVAEVVFPGVANNLTQKLNAGQHTNGHIGGKHESVYVQDELIYDPDHLVM